MVDDRQRFEILLEDMTGKLQAVAEGHQIIRREIEINQQETKKDIALLRAILGGGIEDIRDRVDGLDEKIEVLEREVRGMRKDMNGLEKRVNAQGTRLDGRIDELEERLGSKIDNISGVLVGYDTRIKRLESRKAA